jgi:predicted phosphodiesterase
MPHPGSPSHDPVTLRTGSRRAFLRHLAVAGSSLALSRRAFAAADDPGTWYAWLSDIHIAADPKASLHDQVMADNLRAVVTDILAQSDRPRGVVITGDLAVNHGESGDYETLFDLLAPLRQARVPVHLVLGNHDDREHFRAAFHAEPPAEEAVADRHVTVVTGPGGRFLLLDSLQGDNLVPGRLGERQLGWLAKALDADPQTPTILFLHHPPDPDGKDLVDGEDFLTIVEPRRQVKAIVFGHSHHWGHGERDGIAFINLPAVAYPFGTQPLGWVRFRPTAKGGALELRAIGGDRSKDGERVELSWRS